MIEVARVGEFPKVVDLIDYNLFLNIDWYYSLIMDARQAKLY